MDGLLASALISGGSALLGAVIGATASLLGARWQDRNRTTGELTTWRRDRRVAAYGALVTARGALMSFPANPTPAIIDSEREREVAKLVASLEDARGQVEMFGSPEAKNAALAWHNAYRSLRHLEWSEDQNSVITAGREEGKRYADLLIVIRAEFASG